MIAHTDVIAPPTDAEGILLAGDAEANEEEYMANGPYTGPLTIINVPKLHTL